MNIDKNFIIAGAIGTALIVTAGYLLFFKAPAPAVTSTEPTSPEEIAFVNLASQLEPLGFDTSIFSDPRFAALVDIHTPVIPEAAGRRDPFAPLGK
jgi:hypothetical protein